MASGPITSWEIDGETVETVADIILGGSKITTHGDCSHENKRPLHHGRTVMINLDSILKIRDITLPTKVHLVKAKVFPVVMYGCESWTVNRAECWRTDAFELWCWRLLRVPCTARRSNQSILKEISPGCSLEGLMLKLKLQYFGHLMRRADSSEKTLMLGKTEGSRRRGWQRMRWLDGITNSITWVWVNAQSLWMTMRPGMLWYTGSQRVGHDWATELNWIYWKDQLFTLLYFYFLWHCLINYISGDLFLGLSLVPLSNACLLVSLPTCFDYYSSVGALEIRDHGISGILLSNYCFSYSRYFVVLIQILGLFDLILWRKNAIHSLIEIALNL